MRTEVRFSKAQCRALKRTFGSWDWRGRPRDTRSGDEHYQRVHALIVRGASKDYCGAVLCRSDEWQPQSVRLLISLIRSTLNDPDHSHGCKTQYRAPVRNRHVRTALGRRISELIDVAGLQAIDALADLGLR